jgi:fused signal recognition particle receptor
MFKKLKDKFSSWLKKKPDVEEKVEEKPAGASQKELPKDKPKVQEEKKEVSKVKDRKKILKKKVKELNNEIEQLKKSDEPILDVISLPKEKPKKETSPQEPKVKTTQPKGKPTTPLISDKPQQIDTLDKDPETPIEEPETPSFFTKLKNKITQSPLTQEQFDEIFPDLEITLLENNVALEVTDKIHDSLSSDLVGIPIKKSNIESTILSSLKNAISNSLIEPPSDFLDKIKNKLTPYTIILVGINGSGKTTTIAKLAHYLKQNGISCVLAAGDTFRAASIEQLKEHANNLKIPIISQDYGADPAAVAFDAKKYAEAHRIKAVLIDTAGRMYTKTNLIKEMEKIVRVSSPDLKIFVGESITGNDATEQAKTFNEAINIDGIILSKADIDEKAGTILSVSHITKKPIYFLGTGQKYEDLQLFSKETVLKNLGLK